MHAEDTTRPENKNGGIAPAVFVDLETGIERPFSSPEHIGQSGMAASCHHDPSSSLAVGWSPEEIPSSYRRMGSAIPPRGSSTSWSSGDGREPCDWFVSPSSDFLPASEYCPAAATPSSGVFCSPEVCSPCSATQSRRATTPGVASSGSCCVPAVPAGFDALLPSRSPRCFQPGALLGFTLQSLTRQGSLSPLGAASPPAIGLRGVTVPDGHAVRRSASPRALVRLHRLSASAHDGVVVGCLVRGPVRPGSSTARCDRRRGPDGGPARPRSRGLIPLSRWSPGSASLRVADTPALLGFSLPGALPSPALA